MLAGVVARRSARDRGHGGLAQVEGFRTPVQMVKEITGATRGEAIRAVKVGEALVAGVPDLTQDAEAAPLSPDEEVAVRPWHEPLGDALLAGRLSSAQVDAIRRGLGEPPAMDRPADDVREVWRVAAMQLIDEATSCSVEDLIAAARSVRDAIDPAGAEERWRDHYAARSFRMRTDAEGRRHGHIVFDDATFAFWQTVMDAALRPRRGGPRFLTDEERAAASELRSDPRTNEQLAYDLITDLVHAGAKAEAKDVFGARCAGVRVVTIHDDRDGAAPRDLFERLLQVAHSEDGALTVPGSIVERLVCDLGITPVTLDAGGNPLDIGRDARLFSSRQRIALATRDGGCIWPGCDRPPSMTEAHHIDEWVRDEGATDIDRGVLLCAFHHVHLHMTGRRITREGKGPFLLLPPPGDLTPPIELRTASPLRWMFDPPERRPWRRPSAA
ncbi:MAG: DUF222 domain-containing protein [Microbacterium sp.]|uniref:HNH endonuclease signature motif containing protein n=1 Tax=Microbacterium sp. TaxID=51671 RepID=UPI001ACF0094|nr:HNH endonuclease signature motif containing protein [Microbacterium sp.]MBN9177903.1 DUF222 domain-containing protein [Microbacterium sp.]